MAIDHPAAVKLKQKYPEARLRGSQFRGDTQIIVPRERLVDVATFLKNDPDLNYNMLADISAVDYYNYPGKPREGRFGIVYVLNSVPLEAGKSGSARLILRVFLDEARLEVESMVPLYAGAEWLEREVFDMFGIRFANHPDLRRILTWDTFGAYPLRKDYPVTGKGERENYAILSRDSA